MRPFVSIDIDLNKNICKRCFNLKIRLIENKLTNYFNKKYKNEKV